MTPIELHEATLARLGGLTTVAAYNAAVPENLPADGDGRVHPYVVLWPVPGRTPEAARNLENDLGGGYTWDARVTVASGDPTWTLQAVQLVRARLEGWRLLPGSMVCEVDSGGVSILEDRDTTPHRWYVPLTFRTSV